MKSNDDKNLDSFQQGIDAALRRAAARALELGLRTNSPVWVMKDGKLADLTKEAKQNA